MGADPVRSQWPGQGCGGRRRPGQRIPRHSGRRCGGHRDSGCLRRRWPEPNGRPASAHGGTSASLRADRPGIRPTAVGTRAAAGQRTTVGPSARSAPRRNGIAAQARASAPGPAVLGHAGRGRVAWRRSAGRGPASTGPVTGRAEARRPCHRGQHPECSGHGSPAPRSAATCPRSGAAPARFPGASVVCRRTPRPQAEPRCRGNALPRGSRRAGTSCRQPWSRLGILPGRHHGQPTGRLRGRPGS